MNKRRIPTVPTDEADFQELVTYLVIAVAVVAFGTVGYEYIEGWNFSDSVYMTVITVGTVGFGEIHPLSEAGRWFTILLIILGLGLVTVVFSAIAQRIVLRQLTWTSKGQKMLDSIEKLRGHTIFCGFGRLTKIAAKELLHEGAALVIVDKDPLRVEAARAEGYLALEGDSTIDKVLIQAGILHAKRLVSLLPKDADNLYVILTARELNSQIYLLSRSEDEANEKRLSRAGADRIISPYRIGGHKIAEGLMRPFVTDFLDLAVSSNEGNLQIEEIKIPLRSAVAGLTLQNSALRQKTNVIVAALVSEEGEMIFNPAAETEIKPGSTFIAIGRREDLLLLEKLLLAEAE